MKGRINLSISEFFNFKKIIKAKYDAKIVHGRVKIVCEKAYLHLIGF